MAYRDASVNPSAADGDLPAYTPATPTGDESEGSGPSGAQTPGDTPTASERRSSRSHRSHHHHHHHGHSSGGGSRRDKQRRQVVIARVVAILAITVGVVLSVLLISVRSQLATRNHDTGILASTLNRTQSELTETKQLVAAQEVELGALLKQRIPGVARLETEQLIDVNNRYVKKLMFSEAGTGMEKRLTYSAVLKNTGNQPITPAVTILLFDRKGLQTGMAQVIPSAATAPGQEEQLQPGETRSYSGLVQRIRSDADTHSYFLVEVK